MYLQIDEIFFRELLLAVIPQIRVFPLIQLNVDQRQVDIFAILSEFPPLLPLCGFFLIGIVHLLSEIIIDPKWVIAY
jgi:hypothetical protein